MNDTNPSEISPHTSELDGREHSLIVAASVILILLMIFFSLLWQHKKQQLIREVNEAVTELPSLPVFVQVSTDVAELRDCAVCLTEIGVGNSARLLPACGHTFHKGCIDLWFRYRSTCPVCRAHILPEQPSAHQKEPAAAG